MTDLPLWLLKGFWRTPIPLFMQGLKSLTPLSMTQFLVLGTASILPGHFEAFERLLTVTLFSYLFRVFSFLSKWWWEHEEGIWGQSTSNKGESQESFEPFPRESRFSFWCRPEEWWRCRWDCRRGPLPRPPPLIIDVPFSSDNTIHVPVVSLDIEHRGVKSAVRSSLVVLMQHEDASAIDDEAYETFQW